MIRCYEKGGLKLNTCILFILFITSIMLISCALNSVPVQYGTRYFSNTNKRYLQQTPCNVRFIKKAMQNEKYAKIGVCTSTMRPSYTMHAVENNAFQALRNCACAHGGEIVRILEYEEVIVLQQQGLLESAIIGAKSAYVQRDALVGEVYVIEENIE